MKRERRDVESLTEEKYFSYLLLQFFSFLINLFVKLNYISKKYMIMVAFETKMNCFFDKGNCTEAMQYQVSYQVKNNFLISVYFACFGIISLFKFISDEYLEKRCIFLEKSILPFVPIKCYDRLLLSLARMSSTPVAKSRLGLT